MFEENQGIYCNQFTRGAGDFTGFLQAPHTVLLFMVENSEILQALVELGNLSCLQI